MNENMLSSVALPSSFVLAIDLDLVVDMGQRLLGICLKANYFGQDMESQVMHSNCMDDGSKAKPDTGANFCRTPAQIIFF